MQANTEGEFNTASGFESMRYTTTGSKNTASGYQSLKFNTTGTYNAASGYQAMQYNTGGSYNSAYGFNSLRNNVGGSNNVAFGMQALYSTQGDNNTAIGRNAGMMNTTGAGNVFIGFSAGNNTNYQTASNKLAIANSDTETPLIAGDFSAATLKVNGSLDVTGSMTMSVADAITESTVFNGNETIIPVYTTGTITIDSDQLVQGRILIFKSMTGTSSTFTLATEGVEQIQSNGSYLSDTIDFGGQFETMRLFSNGSNWYEF
jgi:hypothetical protein